MHFTFHQAYFVAVPYDCTNTLGPYETDINSLITIAIYTLSASYFSIIFVQKGVIFLFLHQGYILGCFLFLPLM